jgi:membrane-anchored protein YejM (alkaline phosphatase superfamily)
VAGPDTPPPPAGRRQLGRFLGWFALANGALGALAGLRILALYEFPPAALALAYTAFAYLGHYASLGLLVLLPAFVVGLVWPRWALVRLAAVLPAALLLTLLVVDGNVFAAQRYHLTPLAVAIFAPATWAFIAVIGVTVLVFQWLLSSAVAGFVTGRPRRGGGLVLGGLAVVWLAGQGIHIYADAVGDTAVTGLTRYLPAYFPIKAKRRLTRLGLVDPATAERQRLLARAGDTGGAGPLRYPQEPLACPDDVPAPRNLVVVLIDGLRPDAVDPRLTPTVAGLQDEGQTFLNHWSGGNSSRAGIFSFFYGVPSTYVDAFYGVQQPPVLLAELRRRDYQLALHAAPGFSTPTDLNRTVFAGVPGLPGERRDVSAVERNRFVTTGFVDWLATGREAARPFFAFLYYDPPMGEMPVHAVPLALDDRFPPGRPGTDPKVPGLWRQYRHAMQLVDAELGKVDAALTAAGLRNDTLLVVFSDHGYEFDDYGTGYVGHASTFSDAQLRSVLVMRWPGRPAARLTHRTSHLDVPATLVGDWLGCTSPAADYSAGRSLFAGTDWPWLVAGSYGAHAIVEPGRRTVTQPGGFVEVRGPDYRPLAGATLDPAVVEAALAGIRRFYQ